VTRHHRVRGLGRQHDGVEALAQPAGLDVAVVQRLVVDAACCSNTKRVQPSSMAAIQDW
jgi:hypothetical protein